MHPTQQAAEAFNRSVEADAAHGLRAHVSKLERENRELRALLLECKRAFLGYPQELRRTPLDLLRDMNAALATEGPAQGTSE